MSFSGRPPEKLRWSAEEFFPAAEEFVYVYLRRKKKEDGKRGCVKKDDTSVTALSSSCTSYHFFAHNFLLPCFTVTKPSDQMEINWPLLNHSETFTDGTDSEIQTSYGFC